MNAPVGKGPPGPGRRPTRQQLEAARIRARTTGETLEQALAVFMGAGRYGSEAEPVAPAPGYGFEPAHAEAEHLAAVLPFTRARRNDTADPGDGERED
ncbi:hypothetical protein ACFPA8_09020 [Streptomyces ovatisporus]|uniref:Uncharacterized protein n=1 Tax=Streptomyces ovatisporus TaxID=1128682 RepID=A0ABV9A2Z8_9ACTN